MIKNRGFTLIELSIVIVIIALVAGGIIIGREMIESAQRRKQIAQIEEVNTAIVTFKIKYNCLPGDCSTATQFFGATSQPEQVTNGNGDGRIRGYGSNNPTLNVGWISSTSSNAEWRAVFDHLSAANLWKDPQYDETVNISLAGYNYPRQILPKATYAPDTNTYTGDGGIVAGYEPGGHTIRIGACYLNAWGQQSMVFGCNPKPSSIQWLDRKMDDGNLLTGRAVVTIAGYTYNHLPELGGSGIPPYFASCSAAADNSQLCAWTIKASF